MNSGMDGLLEERDTLIAKLKTYPKETKTMYWAGASFDSERRDVKIALADNTIAIDSLAEYSTARQAMGNRIPALDELIHIQDWCIAELKLLDARYHTTIRWYKLRLADITVEVMDF